MHNNRWYILFIVFYKVPENTELNSHFFLIRNLKCPESLSSVTPFLSLLKWILIQILWFRSILWQAICPLVQNICSTLDVLPFSGEKRLYFEDLIFCLSDCWWILGFKLHSNIYMYINLHMWSIYEWEKMMN